MKVLITGGAGFIGCHAAAHFLAQGHEVVILDNLSRGGVAANVRWLLERYAEGPAPSSTDSAGQWPGPGRLGIVRADLRDWAAVRSAARGAELICHLGGQVAVTTSVANPRTDFEVNALGTLNVLEAARASRDDGLSDPIVLFSSTNKVYGGMGDIGVLEQETRYTHAAPGRARWGTPETQPLDFHSPYGCSKGAADQYCRDYARIYGLRTVVFRQSAIYGTRQFGSEDQAWVAWLVIAAVTGKQITIYGDGKQVRDVLWVDDLVRAYDQAVRRIDRAAGQVYNMGGGPAHTVSVWCEFGSLLSELLGRHVQVRYGDWRPGDQRVYVSDIRRASADLDWQPQVGVAEGVERLVHWVEASRELFR